MDLALEKTHGMRIVVIDDWGIKKSAKRNLRFVLMFCSVYKIDSVIGIFLPFISASGKRNQTVYFLEMEALTARNKRLLKREIADILPDSQERSE